jgi:hypothetical protein
MRSDGGPNWPSGHAVGTTDPAGGHTHTVTISGGGDPQTRPISFSVRWLIRIKAINGGARGPAGAAGAKGADGDGWTIGDIKQSILTETQFKAQFSTTEAAKWVLADGRNVAGTAYATLTGSATVPDLRGGYLRMAGQNSTNTAWNGGTLNSYQEDTTRAPRNTAFTADSNGGHRHSAGIPSWSTDDFAHYGINDTGVSKKISNVDGWSSQTPYTDYAAAHTHSVSGGDTETRPKSYTVNYFIKVN